MRAGLRKGPLLMCQVGSVAEEVKTGCLIGSKSLPPLIAGIWLGQVHGKVQLLWTDWLPRKQIDYQVPGTLCRSEILDDIVSQCLMGCTVLHRDAEMHQERFLALTLHECRNGRLSSVHISLARTCSVWCTHVVRIRIEIVLMKCTE